MYKNLFDRKKVIIFDLNGTIADTENYWFDSLYRVMGQIGVFQDNAEVTRGMYIGNRIDAVLRNTGNPSKIPLAELIRFANDDFLNNFKNSEDAFVRPGFFELVVELQKANKQIALVSNADKFMVDSISKILNIEGIFNYVLAGDMVSKRKPDPQMYNDVAKHFGVSFIDCLVFEDSYIGLAAADRAKMDTIAIYDPETEIKTTRFPQNVLFYDTDFDYIYKNFDSSLSELIEKMEVLNKDTQLQDNNLEAEKTE